MHELEWKCKKEPRFKRLHASSSMHSSPHAIVGRAHLIMPSRLSAPRQFTRMYFADRRAASERHEVENVGIKRTYGPLGGAFLIAPDVRDVGDVWVDDLQPNLWPNLCER